MAKEKVSKYSNIAQKISQTKDFLVSFDYKGFYKSTVTKAKVCYKDLQVKLGDLSSTNYELGIYHYNNGNIVDARFRLWLYTKIWQGKPEVEYFLGRANFELGKLQSAIFHLQRYLDSGHKGYIEECNYTLQLAKGIHDQAIIIPMPVIRHKYDCRANSDYLHFEENIEASPQKKLCSDIGLYLNKEARPYGNRLLDIGCGTGVVGKLLREAKIIGFATGVDLSGKMCTIAAAHKDGNNFIYDQVLNIPFDEYLEENQGTGYDLVVLSGFLESYANSAAIFKKINACSSTNSVLVVMFKSTSEAPSKFIPSVEEYLHNPQKIKEELKNMGWDIAKEDEVIYSQDMRGKYYICKKS